MKCIYCNKEVKDNWPLIAICKNCCDLWNKNWEKFMPHNEEYKKLRENCEKEVKQIMTGHSCGQERLVGGGEYRGRPAKDYFCSSDCIGCFPDTQQHYRNASDLVIAWTENYVKKYIMKNVLLKKSATKKRSPLKLNKLNNMKIKATKIFGEDLKAGDLFSTANQTYWNNIKNNLSIGEKVYIRTDEPCPKGQEKEEIYRITIET